MARRSTNRSAELSATDDSPDIVRTYLRQLGEWPLLSRESEVNLARRIEEAEHDLLNALLRIPALDREIASARPQARALAAQRLQGEAQDAEAAGPPRACGADGRGDTRRQGETRGHPAAGAGDRVPLVGRRRATVRPRSSGRSAADQAACAPPASPGRWAPRWWPA